MDPTDLQSSLRLEKDLGKYAAADFRRGPDFTDITKVFSNMMAHPTLMARGGTWVDPMQAQQTATPGYLSNRGEIASGDIQRKFSDAALMALAGGNAGSIASLIPQLKAGQLNAGGGAFGQLLGGLL